MAAMMFMLINFNNDCGIMVSINIIAAISWPPPLISELFSHRLFKAAPLFHGFAVFEIFFTQLSCTTSCDRNCYSIHCGLW